MEALQIISTSVCNASDNVPDRGPFKILIWLLLLEKKPPPPPSISLESCNLREKNDDAHYWQDLVSGRTYYFCNKVRSPGDNLRDAETTKVPFFYAHSSHTWRCVCVWVQKMCPVFIVQCHRAVFMQLYIATHPKWVMKPQKKDTNSCFNDYLLG